MTCGNSLRKTRELLSASEGQISSSRGPFLGKCNSTLRGAGPVFLPPWTDKSLRLVTSQQDKSCNLCGHLQRCQMRDIENSRKNSRRRCRGGPGQTAEKQPEKQSKNTRKTAVLTVFRVFFGCFRLFFGCLTRPTRHLLRLFFRLFSMSRIWHLCRWPQRLQGKSAVMYKYHYAQNDYRTEIYYILGVPQMGV